MKRLFYGGVHPPEIRGMRGDAQPIALIPRRVVIPMLQHIGSPCAPLVHVGERVRMGEKIGDGEGLCVPVHASVSGEVIAVEERVLPTGRRGLCAVIENDFQDEEARLPAELPDTTDAETLLRRIREAGLAGMGGAAFPSEVKLRASMNGVDTLIANACECEPYITADACLLHMEPHAVLRGMEIISRLLQPRRKVLAVEDDKVCAIARLREALLQYPQIELKVLPTRYPQGAERQLIQALTGREVRGGRLPAEWGCIVCNVSTLAAVDRALREGRALTQRIVTLAGGGIRQPQNFLARIGTPFQDLIAAAGGTDGRNCRVIGGGPMMGVRQEDWDVPVVKATNAILCLPEEELAAGRGGVCIRCGKCVAACPMHLLPLYLYRAARAENHLELKGLGLTDCIECGCCAFVCPGELPLVEWFRRSKQRLKEAKGN